MNECIYIPHISHIVSRRFTILIEWDRTSACKGPSSCRYQFLFDLTRPPNPCMKCTMKLQIDHHTGNYVPYSFRVNRLSNNPALVSTILPDMSPRSNRKPILGQRSTLIKHMNSTSYKREPAIWSRGTGQRITWFDRCQLIITWCHIS